MIVKICILFLIIFLFGVVLVKLIEDVGNKAAEDNKIQNDIGVLGEELDIYKGKYGQYPKSLEVLVTAGQFKQMPNDQGQPYNYAVTQNGSSAKISQKLHSTSDYWCWKPDLPRINSTYGRTKKVQSEAECQP